MKWGIEATMFNLDPTTIISRILILIIALSVHEFSHAFVADRFGDTTPRAHGRLTLNPAAHLDLMGSLMLILVGFGWARPVPINPYVLNRRSPSALMWVSFAGPLSNLALAFMAAILLRVGGFTYSFSPTGMFPTPFQFLVAFIQINLLLFLFNLIPLAPLDGEKIAQYFFPPAWANFLDRIHPYGPMILMMIIFVGPMLGIDIFGWVLMPVLNTISRLLIGGLG